jgi:hypothetical protein
VAALTDTDAFSISNSYFIAFAYAHSIADCIGYT